MIGPVSTFEIGIPYLSARKRMQDDPEAELRVANVHFAQSQKSLRDEQKTTSSHTLIDPAQWMCVPDCAVGQGATAFYRDDGHLSVAGALHYADKLAAALSPALEPAHEAKEGRGN